MMANEAAIPATAKLETITANQLRIAHGSLNAGSISFQIRNIASLHVTVHDNANESSYIPLLVSGFIALPGSVVCMLILAASLDNFGVARDAKFNNAFFFFGAWLASALLIYVIAFFGIKEKRSAWCELAILTNAASSYKLIIQAENIEVAWKFALQVKECIEAAMEAPDAATYSINIAEQKIEKVEANATTVSHSPGANTIGGSATHVNQASNVVMVAQGLQDISALIGIVEASNTQNAAMLKAHLETVRSTLAGGARSKDEARSAWGQFVEHAGFLAHTGNNVWELIARVGGLVAGWA